MAESFGDLDPKMDVREADLEPGQKWTGWHRIEKDLWPPAPGLHAADRRPSGRRTPTTCSPTPRTLDRARRRTLTFTVDQIGNGAKGLLDEVATGKVTGEEEIWSHTDLYDFQANVDGARVGVRGPRAAARGQGPGARRADRARASTRCRRCSTSYRVGDRLRLLRHSSAEAQVKAALRRRQRARRAAVEADGSRHPVTSSPPDDPPRAPSAVAGCSVPPGPAPSPRARPASAAGPTARASGDRRARRGPRRRYPFHGEHQAGIVTPAQDRLHFAAFDVTTDLARRAGRAAEGVDRRGRADDRRAGRRWAARCPRRTTPRRRHRRGARPAAGRADPDLRLRARRCSATPTARTGSGSPTGSPRRCASCRTSRPTTSTRRAATATCASRPAPTTRRSPCTRSATWPGSASAPSALRWSQLGFGRTSSTSTTQVDPAQPVRLQGRHRQPQGRGARRRRRARVGRRRTTTAAPTGWPAAPTSSPAGSTCTSRPGTAPVAAGAGDS